MKYKILTNDGFKEFSGIRKVPNDNVIELIFDDNKLSCTIDHKIFIDENTCKNAGDLSIGDKVFTKNGYKEIIDINGWWCLCPTWLWYIIVLGLTIPLAWCLTKLTDIIKKKFKFFKF